MKARKGRSSVHSFAHVAKFNDLAISGIGEDGLKNSVLAAFKDEPSVPMPERAWVIKDNGGYYISQDEIDALHQEWQTEHRRRRSGNPVEYYGAGDYPGGQ